MRVIVPQHSFLLMLMPSSDTDVLYTESTDITSGKLDSFSEDMLLALCVLFGITLSLYKIKAQHISRLKGLWNQVH